MPSAQGNPRFIASVLLGVEAWLLPKDAIGTQEGDLEQIVRLQSSTGQFKSGGQFPTSAH